jgi:hypothetical protein
MYLKYNIISNTPSPSCAVETLITANFETGPKLQKY